MTYSTIKAQPSAVRLTLDWVYVVTALIFFALRPLLTPISQNDFWWHMATGRAIVMQGSIPTTDSFSFTRAGEPFFNQSWLSQLLLYGLHEAGGLPLIVVVQAIVIVLAYGLLLRLCILRTERLRLSVVLLLLATMPVSFTNWEVRAQSYVFPIFAAFLTILTEYRLGRANRLWILPLLMILWVNMHGSFVLGLAMIAIVFAGEVFGLFRRWFRVGRSVKHDQPAVAGDEPQSAPRLRPIILWGALTGFAVLINPRGFDVLGYVRNLLSSNQVTRLVTEWAPPTIRETGELIFFVFVAICFLAIAYSQRKPDVTDLLLFFAFLWLALGAVRNIVWFGFVATPLLACMSANLLPAPQRPRSTGTTSLNAILIGLLGLLLVAGLPWFKPALFPPQYGAIVHHETPVAAVQFLQSQPDRPTHLFHAMEFGSYLIWAAPEQKVFIDPRIELYPFEQWRDYINLNNANNIADLMGRYQIDGALLNTTNQKLLIEALSHDPTWIERYRDKDTVYFTRKR
jgi:hypothetical protein